MKGEEETSMRKRERMSRNEQTFNHSIKPVT